MTVKVGKFVFNSEKFICAELHDCRIFIYLKDLPSEKVAVGFSNSTNASKAYDSMIDSLDCIARWRNNKK